MSPRIGNGVGPGGSLDLVRDQGFGPRRRKNVQRMNDSRSETERKSIVNQAMCVCCYVGEKMFC